MNVALNIKTTYKFAVTLLAVVIFAAVSVAVPAYAFASTTFTIPVGQVVEVTYGVTHPGNFNYEMRRLGASYPLPAASQGNIYTFSLAGNEAQNLSPITFTHAGHFYYEIRAVGPSGSGITLDETIYTVVILVSNTQAGGLEARIGAVFMRGPEEALDVKDEAGDIVFRHSYLSAQSLPSENPPVVKTVQGNPATDYTFTFRLEAQSPNNPMPTGSIAGVKEITITGSGRAQFGTWTHDRAGVFVYTVREIPTNNRDYQFDTTVYTITDTVTSRDGQLVVERIVTNDNNNLVTSMSFLNTYNGTTTPGGNDGGSDTTTGTGQGTGQGTGTGATTGPKTGDYTDPSALLFAMAIAALTGLIALFLIHWDRRSEDEHGGTSVVQV